MTTLLEQTSRNNVQLAQSPLNQTIISKFIPVYEQRLKSLIQTSKIYQQTIQKDNQQGALAFMNTQDMKKYRVQRELQLLKDTLLLEKEKITIKILSSYHQLKTDHQQLQKSYSKLKIQHQKLQHDHQKLQNQYQQYKNLQTKNIPQKDIISKTSFQKQSRFTNKIPQEPIESISRISLLSNPNQINSTTSISLYEKMLQQKMILVKQLEKKNKALKEESEQKSQKVNFLEQKLKQTLSEQQALKSCKNCPQIQQNILRLKDLNNKLSTQNEQIKEKLIKSESKLKLSEKDIDQKNIKIAGFENEIQTVKIQLQVFKQKQQALSEKPNKPSPQNNLQIIKELKQKLFLQQQQLMALTNSFQFLKEDLNQSLLNDIKRLRTSHKMLQENIKTSMDKMKKQMVTFVTEIIETVKIKCSNKKNYDEMLKKLKSFDNQLDFFIEQKNIRN